MKPSLVDGPRSPLRVQVDRVEGTALPLLLLHSDAGRLEQWNEVATLLLEADLDRPVARFDFRGHGLSMPVTGSDYSFAGRADDVGAVLDALGWDRVVLIAHSGGNGAGLHFAAAHPDRSVAFLMVDPPTDPMALPEQVREQMIEGLAGPDSLRYLRDYYRSIAGEAPAVVERILDDVGATTAESRLGVGQALMGWTAELADRYAGPTFVIGTDVTDGPSALWNIRTDTPHTVVHGTGHWVNIERPDAVVDALPGLMDRIG